MLVSAQGGTRMEGRGGLSVDCTFPLLYFHTDINTHMEGDPATFTLVVTHVMTHLEGEKHLTGFVLLHRRCNMEAPKKSHNAPH